jgi:sulfur-oxidizing protein SoxY
MPSRPARLDRRTVLLGTAATATVLALAATPVAAQEAQALEAALKRVLGEGKPADGRITLNLPEIAENGNTVPFDFVVDSPMTEADHVKAVHVFAPANPQPDIAGYQFTPLSGRAAVSSRMRLSKTQDVYAVAIMSDGKAFMTKRAIKVTIGGCGG